MATKEILMEEEFIKVQMRVITNEQSIKWGGCIGYYCKDKKATLIQVDLQEGTQTWMESDYTTLSLGEALIHKDKYVRDEATEWIKD